MKSENNDEKYRVKAMNEVRSQFYDYFRSYARASLNEAVRFLELTDDISRDATGARAPSNQNLWRCIIDKADKLGKSPYIFLGAVFQGCPDGKKLKGQLIEEIDGYHHKLLPEVTNVKPKRPKPRKGFRYPSRLEVAAN